MVRYGTLADAPADVVIEQVRVIDPGSGVDEVRDLAVRGGVFAANATEGARRIDGRGLVAAPGLCDLHAHLREPGNEAAETIASGSRAAAHGGYTTICAMPNTEPATDDAARVRATLDRATGASARVRVIAAATRGRAGERLADHAALAEAGAVALCDDGSSIGSAAVMRHALRYAAQVGLPVMQHAEDADVSDGSAMREGAAAVLLGLPGWPSSAEAAVVARDIELARDTGAHLHVTHISSSASLDHIRHARQAGIQVTCDVTPHHLALTDRWVAGERRFAWEETEELRVDAERAYDGATRVNPPLAPRDEALALLAAVADGTVDAIATDHAPHTVTDKLTEFTAAAPGIAGLETALSLTLAAVAAGRIGLREALAALSTRPAALIGEGRSLEPGAVADVVLFDPRATWVVEGSALASRGKNTPLLGMELPGVVLLTIAAGRVTYDATG